MDKDLESLLEIRDLSCSFRMEEGLARALDGVGFSIYPGETLGLVGESGCGKTVTALCIMRLIQDPPGKINGGSILFQGKDLLKFSDREMRKIRGNEISMIFQEPMTSLNPVLTCGYQIEEAVLLHQKVSKKEAEVRTLEMLDLVKIPDPKSFAKSYPHQLSGGMRQRAMIAMALSCSPRLLIADEPTTALDVTIQAQILDLLRSLQERFNMAILMITHDLGVIAETANRVVVMYAGKIMEEGTVTEIFHDPRHPYTLGLKASIPRLAKRKEKLKVIPGRVPDALDYPVGCRFSDRCKYAENRCYNEPVEVREISRGHMVKCWKDIDE
ncbi:MAG: ATP-binding cassette domain-containing protein [Candidatus Latescibacteria bacterium]|nr:ATP-binding cassette domain-containing protein [Candidatus Latescibacterota bacterium]NIO27309.1 ATP-binding cassette domain-containing protein [Candidatus Latescibacterota bacterium]NIO54833.1 ATP-binding cassette domain-containing protein [Candidatus Latescibacterota bacterium]NIT00916.1 ATP-binding cassette domain-containing protein [Candidatus Latescibacterota bacterium]NIT37839.1 ATP-binding cassette domain-containing protein [Candidatus Latescibacterota bacterium]